VSYTVGSLVKARSREWVVLPGSNDEFLLVRPLGGTEDEVTGLHLSLETIESAQFDLPNPSIVGDHRSCRLLRDAVRLSARSGAGPFRSLARIAVDPRPYQFVPLLMALKLEPIRICIADDVGIGKTIEACLIARELLDRGEIQRIAILCPPHLAEQWQKELSDKFHINAELVLPSTASRLERHCQIGQSLFDIYPHVIVSMDFIKNDRRRDEFVRTCPEFVIVDEAHTCAFGFEGKGSRHQRHLLIKQLAGTSRHMVLVTATPHSGKEDTFRSLLAFLNKEFDLLPPDLSGKENEPHRRRLAQHFVQRRRKDIEHFLTETLFPKRKEAEESYTLSTEYQQLFDRAIRYAQKTVKDVSGSQYKQRVRWWSVLALLRSLASSPAAAVATLRERAKVKDAKSIEEADEIGRNSVFDIATDDQTEGVDIVPGSDYVDEGEGVDESTKNRKELLSMAREAEKLTGDKDLKLQKAIKLVTKIIEDGYHPILFCRYIPTAEYVAEYLRSALEKKFKNIEIIAVTGLLPPEERKARVDELGKARKSGKRIVLVCTDCLSEGINLQDHFNAVMHYDLSWSPTRHEQREGRVDRFGQSSENVRVLTYYGIDNKIDGIVIEVLIKKHKQIRTSLGISVPVPVDTTAVTEAIFEGLLLREKSKGDVLQEVFDFIKPQKQALDIEWDNAADREKRSRTVYAQDAIQRAVADEVSEIISGIKQTLGTSEDVALFTTNALKTCRGVITEKGSHYLVDLKEVPRALRDSLLYPDIIKVRFDLPVKDNEIYLNRTHPFVETLATYLVDTALDSVTPGIAKRAGAIRTDAVKTRTTILLVRFRYDLTTHFKESQGSRLVEECALLAYEGAPDSAKWLDNNVAERLLNAEPKVNIYPEQATNFIQKIVDNIDILKFDIHKEAEKRAQDIIDAHQRVRSAAKIKGISYKIEPKLPADIIGIYVFLPA
jgi:superfamily II DNA or RNA helicase/ribosomal protein S17E